MPLLFLPCNKKCVICVCRGYTLFSESSASNDGLVLLIAIGNAVIVVVLVIVMTTVLVCLFKYRCYRAIQAWLLVASASLLFIFSALYAGYVC